MINGAVSMRIYLAEGSRKGSSVPLFVSGTTDHGRREGLMQSLNFRDHLTSQSQARVGAAVEMTSLLLSLSGYPSFWIYAEHRRSWACTASETKEGTKEKMPRIRRVSKMVRWALEHQDSLPPSVALWEITLSRCAGQVELVPGLLRASEKPVAGYLFTLCDVSL